MSIASKAPSETQIGFEAKGPYASHNNPANANRNVKNRKAETNNQARELVCATCDLIVSLAGLLGTFWFLYRADLNSMIVVMALTVTVSNVIAVIKSMAFMGCNYKSASDKRQS